MSSEIAKKNQSLTKAEKMSSQTKLVMQSYANWEEYLSPVPLFIAILGELVYISRTDFSINMTPPTDGYKYIRYTHSFHACLMHVCNSSCQAVDDARNNMNRIRLYTMNVPDYMKTFVKILFHGDDEVVQALLPNQLDKIHAIADNCLELANATEKQFMDVINIIQELLEARVNAEHFYGVELDDINKKLEETKMRKQSAEEAAKLSEKIMETMDRQLQEARDVYNKAMNSLPGGWDMMGIDCVEGLTGGFTTLVNGFTFFLSQSLSSFSYVSKGSSLLKSDSIQQQCADNIEEINIYSKSAEILMCTEFILVFVQRNTIDWKGLYNQKNRATVTDFQVDQFKRIRESLEESPNCKAKEDAQDICDKGIEICEELAEYAPEGKCDYGKTKKLINNIRKLTESARRFDSKSKNVTKSPALIPKPPMMFEKESKCDNVRASKRASDNARFRIEQSRAQLDSTRELYEKRVENMKKNQKELTETMRNCELKETDFNTNIKMLIKAVDAMWRVKEQWENMVCFFQMMSNIVKISLNTTLKDFVSTSEKTQTLSYNAKLFSRDMLYNQAFQATNIASLVHMISATYSEVSYKHIMNRLRSVGNLMVMDMEKPEFLSERQQLQESCDEVQKTILRFVLKDKEEFERRVSRACRSPCCIS